MKINELGDAIMTRGDLSHLSLMNCRTSGDKCKVIPDVISN